MKRSAWVAALATASMATAVHAEPQFFMTGNELLRRCTADLGGATGQADRMFCTAYVTGTVDSESWLGAELKKAGKTPGICLPAHVEAGQAVEIVTAYLRAHPEQRASNASTLVVVALFAAWPCSA